MIEPISQNVCFKGDTAETKSDRKLIKNFTDVLKSYNNVTNTAAGIARGTVEGTIGVALTGVIAKNIKQSKGSIWGTIKGIGKDTIKAGTKAIMSLPSLFTKTPIQNGKKALETYKNFFKKYMKGNKVPAAIALGVGAAIFAVRTIQGKIHANQKNADIDHKTNMGHIK